MEKIRLGTDKWGLGGRVLYGSSANSMYGLCNGPIPIYKVQLLQYFFW